MNKILSASNGISSFTLKVAIPLAILSFQTQALHAADGVELTDSGLELTVTANRRAQEVNDTLSAITVISRSEIEKIQATSLAEVLTRVPGINISNSGGLGKVTSVFIRGTNSGQLLVLVDGVRHGSATLGSTNFQDLPVDQIERIEVVRGSRSSIYGSDAIGGVVQIFTRKGKQGFQPSIEIAGGSNDTFKGVVNLSGGNDKTTYNLSAQSLKTNGIDACNSATSACFADEPDNDGYENNSVSLNLSHSFSDVLKGQLTLLHAEGENEFDGNFQNESEFVQQVINAQLSADVSDKLNLKFSVGQSVDESDNFIDGSFTGNFDTKRNTASLIADYSVNDKNSFLFGADFYDSIVNSNTDYDITSRNNTGVFASYLGQFNKTQLNVSLRNDDNEQFGSEATGGISIGQNISDLLVVRTSYGTAFNAPTFNQLYYPFDFGNENLVPEESKNFEIGLDGIHDKGTWSLNLFQNDIDNLISTTADYSTSENIDEVRIRGVEGIYKTRLGNYDFGTNVTLQKPEARSGDNEGNILKNRPRRILNVDLDRKFNRFSLGATLHAESERFSDAENTESLGGFARLDLRAEYDVSKNWTVGLKVENALDKEYSLNSGYNQDGVSGLLSVKYSPK